MKRLFLFIIVSFLALSAIYGSISLRSAGKANSVFLDFTENSEGEIEVFDLRSFTKQLYFEVLSDNSKGQRSVSYAEELIFINFQEVPIPPPKS